MLSKSWEAVIKFFDDFSLLAIQGEGLKILTPKQTLQRLPIALAQVKAGIASESLLNKVRKIACSLYWSRKIPKKYAIM